MKKVGMKVGIIGTGNWGTTIGHLISRNVRNTDFYEEVLIWGIEEEYEGESINNLINEKKENKKYLPGIKLGDNLRYTSRKEDIEEVDIIIVALPHQFINTLIDFKIKKDKIVLTVVKGFIENDMDFKLVSEYINEIWECNTSVLMGANIAKDVAKGVSGNLFYKSEGTLGSHINREGTPNNREGSPNNREGFLEGPLSDQEILFNLLDCMAYRISITSDIIGVEVSGSLKNIIALGYGVLEGLGTSLNTKVAFLRRGLIEMKNFIKMYSPQSSSETLFESCGMADLIVSCMSGRNYKFGVARTKNVKLADFEKSMGNQKIQGVGTVNCLYNYLILKDMIEEYPIFRIVWEIFCDDKECIRILESF